jgi:MoaA/NifB/PqqE/SkfB family radical SAM enzyme
MNMNAIARKFRSRQRSLRQARMVASAIKDKHHPLLAHIIPMRRCNLACGYCNEYDKVSNPVPLAEMLRRVEQLAMLGTSIITISGGEPLLHPELDDIIRAIRGHGAIATIITNGYLLTPERIDRLNRAGLDHLQISIDNVIPDDISKKSLKVLDRKLQWLAEHALFDVNINSVLGGGMAHPEDALTITRRAIELGFDTSVGILHDHDGQLKPLAGRERAVYDQILSERKPSRMTFAYDNLFHKNLALGEPNDWMCRAGSRYLYVCEEGLVHYCSQQRGYPAIPLAQYTQQDLDREYSTVKPCAPFCTVSCVHRVAMIDLMRNQPRVALDRFFPPAEAGGPPQLPAGVQLLTTIFLPPESGKPQGTAHKIVAGTAMKLFGVKAERRSKPETQSPR